MLSHPPACPGPSLPPSLRHLCRGRTSRPGASPYLCSALPPARISGASARPPGPFYMPLNEPEPERSSLNNSTELEKETNFRAADNLNTTRKIFSA